MMPCIPVIVAVLVVLAFFACCVFKPVVGKIVARVFGVVFLGGGVGGLTWGICAAALGEEIRSPFGIVSLIASPSEAIGWGTGLLTAGIASLVLSFLGRKSEALPQP